MKIYEKPLVDIKTFDVEDVMYVSGQYNVEDLSGFNNITGDKTGAHGYSGVVFKLSLIHISR